MNKMLLKCIEGDHDLQEINNHGGTYDEYEVARWCKICGSVVVDVDVDNRIYPGHVMKMKTPEITKKVIANEKE